MAGRKGERIGWVGGWLGGFIWVGILSVIFLFQGKWVPGSLGMVLTCSAVVSVVFFAPWRYHSTPYWKLMMMPYLNLFLAIFWSVWSYGGIGAMGLNWWNLFLLLPIMLPLVNLGRMKWEDGGP